MGQLRGGRHGPAVPERSGNRLARFGPGTICPATSTTGMRHPAISGSAVTQRLATGLVDFAGKPGIWQTSAATRSPLQLGCVIAGSAARANVAISKTAIRMVPTMRMTGYFTEHINQLDLPDRRDGAAMAMPMRPMHKVVNHAPCIRPRLGKPWGCMRPVTPEECAQ